jgi:apolipoprotein N-acyltransferase
MRRMKPLLGAAVGGLIVAASLPPFDLWFLAPIGYALFVSTLLDGSRRTRTARAGGFFLAYFIVGLAWSVEFSVVAFVALLLLEVLLATAPFALTPQAPRVALLAFPALIVLGEVLRYRVPLGGLPMAGPVLGQVDGPLLPMARIGGDFSIVLLTALAGAGLFALWRHRALGVVALVVTTAFAALGWILDAPPTVAPLRVAYVQGGGPRGLRAVENTETDVFGNQVDATARVRTPVDLVVWPEDVIDLTGPIAEDAIRFDVGALATKLEATLIAGVVEDSGETKFRNAAVAWDRSGKIVDRYDKVHRVPFGEYVPARGLVSRIADISAVPRDSLAGRGDGVLLTRAGELGVLISYEVFFADRARTAVNAGAEILLVPTNASSFRGRQVPAQEVAAARLRAVESGRDLVQAAPTGHSAFVDANGNTSKVSKLGPAAAANHTLHRRHGRTPYTRAGDMPLIGLALLMVVGSVALDRSVKTNL